MKKKTKVKTDAHGAVIGFGFVITPILTATLGPIGLLTGIVATAAGYRTATNDARRQLEKYNKEEHEQSLISNGYRYRELSNNEGAGNNPLMSAIFGNEIKIRTKFSRK